MKKLLNVSVGIPAYNEESNIKRLIVAILQQSIPNAHLSEIIIVSDGSYDRTSSVVQSLGDGRIKLITNEQRQGKALTLNRIIKEASGEVLVVLDGDILPEGKNFLKDISLPIYKNRKVGIVGAETISTNSMTFFEKVIADSHKFKNQIYKKIDHGNNIFLCHGRALAFSRDLYTKMQLLNDYPTDAQSYLFCLQKGYEFRFEPRARVKFRSPMTLSDHIKQHQRFVRGKNKLKKLFPGDSVRKQYKIPKLYLLELLIKFFIHNPLTMIFYSSLTLCLILLTPTKNGYSSKWTIANTTKNIAS